MQGALVYPHQLFHRHPALRRGRPVFLVEDPLLFGSDPHWPAAMHKKKLVLHRASMRARIWDKMPAAKQRSHRAAAERFLASL